MVGVLEQNDCILEKYEKEIQLVNKKDDVEVANKSNEVVHISTTNADTEVIKPSLDTSEYVDDINGIESGKTMSSKLSENCDETNKSTNALKTDDTVQSKETVLSYNKTDLNSPLKSEESFFTMESEQEQRVVEPKFEGTMISSRSDQSVDQVNRNSSTAVIHDKFWG